MATMLGADSASLRPATNETTLLALPIVRLHVGTVSRPMWKSATMGTNSVAQLDVRLIKGTSAMELTAKVNRFVIPHVGIS